MNLGFQRRPFNDERAVARSYNTRARTRQNKCTKSKVRLLRLFKKPVMLSLSKHDGLFE
jgi:hypothetical protein